MGLFVYLADQSGKIMISRAVFYPSLLYNIMMERVAGRHWFDRIDETVVLGALPLRSVTDEVVSSFIMKSYTESSAPVGVFAGVGNVQPLPFLSILSSHTLFPSHPLLFPPFSSPLSALLSPLCHKAAHFNTTRWSVGNRNAVSSPSGIQGGAPATNAI